MMQFRQRASVRSAFLLVAATLVASCQKSGPLSLGDIDGKNRVTAGDAKTDVTVGEGGTHFLVLGNQALHDRSAMGKVLRVPSEGATQLLSKLAEKSDPSAQPQPPPTSPVPSSPASPSDDSLVVGFPVSLLSEHQVFGAVITALSDSKSTELGDLKLTDLPPVHVRTIVANTGNGQYALALVGCASDCKEGATESPLIGIPIVGVDPKGEFMLLDLASLGEDLNLIAMLDPKGQVTHLKTKTARTVSFDYSLSTLVFDVEVKMEPVAKKLAAAAVTAVPSPSPTPAPETVFTVRWYLKLTSTFDPSFEPRTPTDGVGYFLTARSVTPHIERRVKPAAVDGMTGDGPVKYFIKNVPAEYRPGFSAAFDAWNDRFVTLTGQKIFSYEFVDASDPQAKLLVTGDPRYNIVEWDEENSASYGGLGPSLANQFTGEIFSGSVLIQGPHIVDLYTQWYQTSTTLKELRLAGRDEEADALWHDATTVLNAQVARSSVRYQLQLGQGLAFRVPGQEKPWHDPVFERIDFESTPAGVSYDDYMTGYFREMLTHELGHNLGLRHNFRGSLGADLDPATGGVSDSIMEYLGRSFRSVNQIGDYDLMAIRYGYKGEAPKRRDLYCTDEDVPSLDNGLTGSAECSSDDATTDPFQYLESQLVKAVDLLVARGSAKAPVWSVADMSDELGVALKGMTLYAATSDPTASQWTNFFHRGDRPDSPAGVKAYVLAKLKSHICDPSFASVLKSKESNDAREKTVTNIQALGKAANAVVTTMKAYAASDLNCSTP